MSLPFGAVARVAGIPPPNHRASWQLHAHTINGWPHLLTYSGREGVVPQFVRAGGGWTLIEGRKEFMRHQAHTTPTTMIVVV